MTKLCKLLFLFQFLLGVIWKPTMMSIMTTENTMLLDAMHAMIPHPQNIQDRDAPDPNPDKGSTCTCAQRVTSSPTVSSCIFREHDIVSGFFYNQADVISEAIKEPCISEKTNLTNKSSVNALIL